jgi:hypothetical protein
VHVVWSEYPRDYLPSTLRTASPTPFTLVVYPFERMGRGLYRIQIFAKDPLVGLAGPLSDGMVVPRGALPGQLVERLAVAIVSWSVWTRAMRRSTVLTAAGGAGAEDYYADELTCSSLS